MCITVKDITKSLEEIVHYYRKKVSPANVFLQEGNIWQKTSLLIFKLPLIQVREFRYVLQQQ